MAQEAQLPHVQVNLDVQRLADAITNRNDLFVLIPQSYEGDPKKFQNWVKQIEKYAFMTETPVEKVKLIAYKTSSGPVSDFIERYITNHPTNSWQQLKQELVMRFAEISDPEQASKMLREIKQKKDENVQCYAERLLSLASEAYAGQPDAIIMAKNNTNYSDFFESDFFKTILKDNENNDINTSDEESEIDLIKIERDLIKKHKQRKIKENNASLRRTKRQYGQMPKKFKDYIVFY